VVVVGHHRRQMGHVFHWEGDCAVKRYISGIGTQDVGVEGFEEEIVTNSAVTLIILTADNGLLSFVNIVRSAGRWRAPASPQQA